MLLSIAGVIAELWNILSGYIDWIVIGVEG